MDQSPRSSTSNRSRLAWLDVLRGIAALTVAFHHGSYCYTPHFRSRLVEQFNPGAWGVLVFFLVSGYIIPASLERTGSVRRFWIGRLFRIHPMLLVAMAAAIVLSTAGGKPLSNRLGADYDALAVTLAHATMLQDLLGVPSLINVLWTLSYEMVFYLLVVALFTVRQHHRSAAVALVLTGAAAAFAAVLPAGELSARAGLRPVVVVAVGLVAVAIGLACTRSTALVRAGALLGGATGLVLVLANGRVLGWQGLLLLAMMFLGTAVYRADHGQLRWRWTVLAGVVVVVAGLVLGHWNAPNMVDGSIERAWDTSLLLAVAAFAAAMALRDRRMPRALAWLGVVSYSVYLLHPVVLIVSDETVGRPGVDRPLWVVGYLAVVVAVAALTHRAVELPFQRIGRRLAKRAEPAPPAAVERAPEPVH
ncbi:acyltransferase family protein [Actinomadura atramentaria]|uniref:acyltransferase family protein n=1 Tax=Actinomadura atramentaria TaxID=1990 RepID=UPI0003A3B75E|nr:acyltransferase [Actinomadura atramentaria]